VRRRTLLVLGLVALAVVAVACAPNATQSALEPKGPYAEKAQNLFVPVFWVAAAIFFVVEGLLLVFAIRYRHRKNVTRIPPQVHGNTRLEVAWTILPTLILAGVAVPTIATIWDLAAEPTGDVLEVNVLGHQWWWEFDYPEQKILTANELHIPTGKPVYLTLCAVGFGYGAPVPSQGGPPAPSECQQGPPEGPPPAAIGASVIHSFWVPELAGTQDVIPNQTNHLTLQADAPGTYEGQCKEYCGLSHAYMRFTVVAHTPEDFERWVRDQQAPAASPGPGSAAARGAEIFGGGQCVNCHSISGLQAPNGEPVLGSNGAPNLTHLMSRECFRGCTMPITEENLRRWLRNPQAVEAGSWMVLHPPLTEDQIDDLIAFLTTLT
jgi:cytochrome c oxidase subunit 2